MTEIVTNGAAATIAPGKDIVASMVEELKAEVLAVLDEGVTELTLNLKGVVMVDSIGLGLLIAIHNSVGKHGGRLRITGASPDILKLMQTMRLDQHFEVKSA